MTDDLEIDETDGPLTVEWVEMQIAKMARFSGRLNSEGKRDRYDDERLHVAEDQIYHTVLRAISEGRCADPKGCAIAALKTDDMDFTRNYN